MSGRQHHKGKARPRAWHHGRRAGKINEAALRVAERAFDRAAEAAQSEEALALEMRRERVVWNEILVELDRVAPAPAAFIIAV